jgi:hypothetical protein
MSIGLQNNNTKHGLMESQISMSKTINKAKKVLYHAYQELQNFGYKNIRLGDANSNSDIAGV